MVTWWQAFLLGVMEGLTEFLPVSSTGHLILLGDMLQLSGEAADSFEVVIQLGAILAVVIHYRERLLALVRGLLSRERVALRLATAITVAFIPAAALGFLFHKAIKSYLFGPLPVAAALAVGGGVMILIERWRGPAPAGVTTDLNEVTLRQALGVGLAQCAALWPGMSRSMSTIVGGQLVGMSTPVAAEFSFLLALPTLGAACFYDLLKGWELLVPTDDVAGGLLALGVGLTTSFVVGWAVIAGFLHYLQRHGLTPFGIYRIILAAVVWGMVG